jgi:glycerate kinase
MKIVVATDSYKGCMTSEEAGTIIADAFRERLAGCEITVIPMADGGEGTTEAVLRATGGELRSVPVTGPLGDPAMAAYAVLPGGRTAVMEMASASGIELVPEGDLDPMLASTCGTGELIRAAMDEGVRDIILGIGGSATIDGGIGMAQALGYRLLAADGDEVGRGGGALLTVARVEADDVVPELASCRIRVACDVTNPLLGDRGAARVFGPQKGATPDEVVRLESGLEHLAFVWQQHDMLDAVDAPGDGAAGGLGAGLRAFCGAELVPGAELVSEITGFDREIADADLLVTGEGRTDEQSADGKLCMVLARQARSAGARSILISGAVHGEISAVEEAFDAIFASVSDVCTPAEALARGRINLERTARHVAGLLALGR